MSNELRLTIQFINGLRIETQREYKLFFPLEEDAYYKAKRTIGSHDQTHFKIDHQRNQLESLIDRTNMKLQQNYSAQDASYRCRLLSC